MKRSKKALIIAIASASVLVGVFVVLIIAKKDDTKPVATTTTNSTIQSKQSDAQIATAQPKSTEEQLLYLIEEEKLAHDVYSVMYDKYGANVFGNILNSESTHQGRVLTLLQARNIADPRLPKVGDFKNQELQALYNALVAQGNQNATEAYKVGVAIEEKDIKDISVQLSTATEQDVITALEALRSGSESHLRAFNRQL